MKTKVVFEDRYCRPESSIKDGDRLKSVELVERHYDEDGSYVETHARPEYAVRRPAIRLTPYHRAPRAES